MRVGIKGRLELFRKFIRFGRLTLPLSKKTLLFMDHLQEVVVLNGIPMTEMQRSVRTKLISSRW